MHGGLQGVRWEIGLESDSGASRANEIRTAPSGLRQARDEVLVDAENDLRGQAETSGDAPEVFAFKSAVSEPMHGGLAGRVRGGDADRGTEFHHPEALGASQFPPEPLAFIREAGEGRVDCRSRDSGGGGGGVGDIAVCELHHPCKQTRREGGWEQGFGIVADVLEDGVGIHGRGRERPAGMGGQADELSGVHEHEHQPTRIRVGERVAEIRARHKSNQSNRQ